MKIIESKILGVSFRFILSPMVDRRMQFFRDISSFQEIYLVLLFACIRCETGTGDKGRVIIEFVVV